MVIIEFTEFYETKSEALLKWSARTARNAPQVLLVIRQSVSLLSYKCIFEKAFKSGRA